MIARTGLNGRNPRPIKIAMIGDSTMASYAKPPTDRPDLTGWGQVFDLFFKEKLDVAADDRAGKNMGKRPNARVRTDIY